MICYLPEWTDFVLHYFFKVEFPSEVTQTTRCIYYISSVTNPIIYSVRKREFRGGVKRTLKRIGGLCAISFASGTDNVIGVLELRLAFTGIPSIVKSRAAQVAQHKDSLNSRTLNIPKGIGMNLQRCHPPTEEIVLCVEHYNPRFLRFLKKSPFEAEKELYFALFNRVGKLNGKMFSLTS